MLRIIHTFTLVIISLFSMAQTPNLRPLTADERHIIIDKGTEAPFSGKYCKFDGVGSYLCRQCGTPLYRSSDKFDSGCGWPSFDDQIQGAITQTPDPDGRRTEITCAKCSAHLGHIFTGEQFTAKNSRHCVNSLSIEFEPSPIVSVNATDTAIFAGGCFWGVEHLMRKQIGVIDITSGYTGAAKENPTYQEVCTGATGHAEAVRVVYDPAKISYRQLATLFFEIHDPTHIDRQGPDLGNQYRSEIFYLNSDQKSTAEELIEILKSKGYKVATRVTAASKFYPAEQYHQQYYSGKGTEPYCHLYTPRF